MSKYQKLISATPPIAHEDDCDEGFSLYPYFDDNRQDSAYTASQLNGLKKYICSSDEQAIQNNISSPNNNDDNGRGSGCTAIIGQQIPRTAEEQTWEVPLLDDCNDSASYRVRNA